MRVRLLVAALLLLVIVPSAGADFQTKRYMEAYAVCKAAGLRGIAVRYHVKRDEFVAAHAYAIHKSHLLGLRVLDEQGCLQALLHRKPNYR